MLSIAAHGLLIAMACVVTWSVVDRDPPPPPAVSFIQPSSPAMAMSTSPLSAPRPRAADPLPRPPPAAAAPGAQLARSDTSLTVPTLPDDPVVDATFMGIHAPAARRIVYVVDASGSMLLHLASVTERLTASLRSLHPSQSFAILFFRQDSAIAVPPVGRLMDASTANVEAALSWIVRDDHVVPAGSSDPTNALRIALSMRPDVVWLLSENITGTGRHRVAPEALLATLDRLNPADPVTDRRPARINCIQFLTEDASGTMARIASLHGDDDGFVFVERAAVAAGGDDATR